MSKPSAFTVPPPAREKVGQEGFEPSDPWSRQAIPLPGRSVLGRVPVTFPLRNDLTRAPPPVVVSANAPSEE